MLGVKVVKENKGKAKNTFQCRSLKKKKSQVTHKTESIYMLTLIFNQGARVFRTIQRNINHLSQKVTHLPLVR